MTHVFPLTSKQAECLAFIEARLADGEVAPSYEEIAEHLGLKSKSGVHRYVHELVRRGRLVMLPNRARTLTLPKRRAANAVDLRLLAVKHVAASGIKKNPTAALREILQLVGDA